MIFVMPKMFDDGDILDAEDVLGQQLFVMAFMKLKPNRKNWEVLECFM